MGGSFNQKLTISNYLALKIQFLLQVHFYIHNNAVVYIIQHTMFVLKWEWWLLRKKLNKVQRNFEKGVRRKKRGKKTKP